MHDTTNPSLRMLLLLSFSTSDLSLQIIQYFTNNQIPRPKCHSAFWIPSCASTLKKKSNYQTHYIKSRRGSIPKIAPSGTFDNLKTFPPTGLGKRKMMQMRESHHNECGQRGKNGKWSQKRSQRDTKVLEPESDTSAVLCCIAWGSVRRLKQKWTNNLPPPEGIVNRTNYISLGGQKDLKNTLCPRPKLCLQCSPQKHSHVAHRTTAPFVANFLHEQAERCLDVDVVFHACFHVQRPKFVGNQLHVLEVHAIWWLQIRLVSDKHPRVPAAPDRQFIGDLRTVCLPAMQVKRSVLLRSFTSISRRINAFSVCSKIGRRRYHKPMSPMLHESMRVPPKNIKSLRSVRDMIHRVCLRTKRRASAWLAPAPIWISEKSKKVVSAINSMSQGTSFCNRW